MDEDPSGTAVSVGKRMDRFELRMREGCLNGRWKRVALAEGAEILKQRPDMLGRRWYEVGGTGVVVTAADPVLVLPKPACTLFELGAGHEPALDSEEVLDCDLRLGAQGVNGPAHGLDVVEDFQSGDVGWRLAHDAGGLRLQEPTAAHFEAFDARGRDRLRPQQEPGEGFRADECMRLCVEPGHRRFGVGHVGSDFTIQRDHAIGERVGHVGFVAAALPVPPRQARRQGGSPVATHDFSHTQL